MFPSGIREHMDTQVREPRQWFWQYLWKNVTQGGLDCCSDIFIGDTTWGPREIYGQEYFIYHVHPFGVSKNLTEVLPRKLTMDEIIKASDAISYAPNFEPHEIVHYFDDDEIF